MYSNVLSIMRMPLAWLSGGVILLLIVVALIAPVLPLQPPLGVTDQILLAPSFTGYVLGTDELGRSVLSQIVHGVRVSLVIGLMAALSASVLGALIGGVAGFAGGVIDLALMRIAEMFQVMPTFILAAMIVAVLGPGELRIVAVIALLSWPQSARLMRGEVLRIKQMDFIAAVRCLGMRESRILLRAG